MMRFKVFVLIVISACSCKAKDSTASGLKEDLKNAMQNYLYKAVNYDSSNVKYHVDSVIYFDGTDKYICDFTVHMKTKLFDTTGVMRANVSKDLKTVNRLY